MGTLLKDVVSKRNDGALSETEALNLFRTERISSGRLAELLGISRWDIHDYLKERGETAQMPTHEEIDADLLEFERTNQTVR